MTLDLTQDERKWRGAVFSASCSCYKWPWSLTAWNNPNLFFRNSGSQKSAFGFTGLRSKVSVGRFLLGAGEETLFPGLSQGLGVTCIPLLLAPNSIFKACCCTLCFHRHTISPLTLFKHPLIRTHVVTSDPPPRDNLIAKSLTYLYLWHLFCRIRWHIA